MRKKKAAVDTAAGNLVVSFKPNSDVLDDLADKVDPYRQQLVEKLEDLTEQARKSGSAAAHDALDKIGPLAKQARKSGAAAAHDALEKITPVLDDAFDKVAPAVETARDKVSDDLLPKLNKLLAEAADHPVAQEAGKRGRATAAALRGDLELPTKKRRAGRVIGTIALLAAAGGVAFVAVRRFLDNRDSEWEAPAPSTYGGSNAPRRADTSPWASTSDSPAPAKAPGTVDEATSEKADEKADEDASSADTATEATDATDAFERRTYGEGSYIGTEPPEGFEIKGNERSMKYHTPDSPAYERTISDVWFASSEAAEQNGFTRAQR